MAAKFIVEKSAQSDVLLLKSTEGHLHLLSSIRSLLTSDVFRKKNPDLVPIYEKAEQMILRGETGAVQI